MIPTRSNSYDKAGCTPTSSNCIIWQGPDLSCINLCNGDSISKVIYKLATELCALQNAAGIDLSELDWDCIVSNGGGEVAPDILVKDAIQLLITKSCANSEDIDALQAAAIYTITAPESIATCLNLIDSSDNVIPKSPEEFSLIIAGRLCQLIDSINDINTDLAAVRNDVEDLDASVDTYKTNTNLRLDEIEETLSTVETTVGALSTALGTGAELSSVIDAECTGTGEGAVVFKLTAPEVPLWTTTSDTVADTLTKMWAAVCDLRGAVKSIQDTCCRVTCDDIMIDFDVRLTDGRQTALLFFGTKTVLPTGFTDCNPIGTKLTITDTSGAQYVTYVKIREDIFGVDTTLTLMEGYEIDLSVSALNPTLAYTFSMDACMTNGGTTCVKCVSVEVPVTESCGFCQITATGSGTAIIVYE